MIDQKAREIAEGVIATRITPLIGKDYKDRIPQLKQRIAAMRSGTGDNLPEVEAARLGIIEGRRQAFEEALEALNDDEVAEAMDCNKVEKYAVHKSAINLAKEAIRALIEESKG